MDLHQKEIQGFFNFPVDNLRASPFLIQYIQEEVTLLLPRIQAFKLKKTPKQSVNLILMPVVRLDS